MRARHFLLLTGLLVLLAACGSGEPAGDHAGAPGHPGEIPWIEGDLDAAFELAKSRNKPLFLYWGAEWCPPCNYLKTKIFKQPEFVETMKGFVPVYLDGDTESAQVLGEELGVLGYPTVIVFNPAGEEIMRMPTAVEIERYTELLGVVSRKMRPVKDTLAEVLEVGPANAASEDLNLLAFYSWGQDTQVELEGEVKVETFRALYEQTPDNLATERSRFLTLYLGAAASLARSSADEESGEAGFALSDDETRALTGELTALLGDAELRTSNKEFVFYSPRRIVGLLYPETSAGRDALILAWDNAAQAIESDESLSLDDRLTACYPRIALSSLARGEEEEPDPELQQHVRDRVAWAGEHVSGELELQSTMSTMAGLLDGVGLADEAEALMTERMDDARAPYYFMSWVAGMKNDAEKPEEALVWYRKAYDNARGRYSRFRYGSIYLRRAMDLAPEGTGAIEADSLEILSELLTFDDAFAGGNYMRLNQLESAYQGWNAEGDHDDLVGQLRDFVHAECGRYPAGDEESQQERCAAFLTDLRSEES